MSTSRSFRIPNPGIFVHKKIVSADEAGEDRLKMDIFPELQQRPEFIFAPVVLKADPSDDNVVVAGIDSPDGTGYYINLSAPAVEGQEITGSFVPS